MQWDEVKNSKSLIDEIKKRIHRVSKNYLFSKRQKPVAQNFLRFAKKRCHYKISCLSQIVQLFTLHLMIYFVVPVQPIK
jgi:hypothetical protein